MNGLVDQQFLNPYVRYAEQARRITKVTNILQNDDSKWALKQANLASENLRRAYRGPLYDIQRHLDVAMPSKVLSEYLRQIETFEVRFTMPVQNHFDELVKTLSRLPSMEALGLASSRIAEINKSIAGLRQPWLNIENKFASLTAVSELHTMATGLLERPPFSDALTKLFRHDFGDWRFVGKLPDSLFTDSIARCDFYRELGFNDTLTDFPQPVFDEILNVSGLRLRVLPEPVKAYRYGLDLDPDEEFEDEVPTLNLEAYGLIYRLETHLRRFIDGQMTIHFGPLWVKRRTPSGIYPEWKRKQQHDIDSGKPAQPLVAYADFTDYSRIICRRDNWDEVFEPFFFRKTDIEESLIRLGPARVCTMHVRVIAPHDHLILLAETVRILRAIGVEI